jgi:hypothetical protein
VGAVFNIFCLVLSFIFPAKNRPPKTSESGGFFRRFSSSLKGKSGQAGAESDIEGAGADVAKGSEAGTNIVADSSRL